MVLQRAPTPYEILIELLQWFLMYRERDTFFYTRYRILRADFDHYGIGFTADRKKTKSDHTSFPLSPLGVCLRIYNHV